MIALVVFLGLVFLWANVATAIAIAQTKRLETAEVQALGWKLAYDEERDRSMASSLSELRVHRPVAMPAHEPEPEVLYAYDPTGLVRESDPR